MMQRIQLWTIGDHGRAPDAGVTVAEELTNTETETLLEDLLVVSPSVLMPGLTLVGRQLQTDGGALDLLGVDQDGQLVIFELKRGTLTREAIAQVLDYASDLASWEPANLARQIEEASGSNGIEAFEDFLDWLRSEHPDAPDLLESEPRMVLVGLGTDERAKRIVSFLTDAGIDIQLLTFHAFSVDGKLMLARTSETATVKDKEADGGASTKAGNQRILAQLAEEQGASALLPQVADFIETSLPQVYRWPGKTGISFSLPERTDEGRPTYRAYCTLYVDRKHRGQLLLSINDRAIGAAPEAVQQLLEAVPGAQRRDNSWMPVALPIHQGNWDPVRPELTELLNAIIEGWQRRVAAQEMDSDEESSVASDGGFG